MGRNVEHHIVVCFLDYDGVLHTDDVHKSHDGRVDVRSPVRRLFEWAPIAEELFAPYPNLRIVLSTNWVGMTSFEEARSFLPPALQRRVIGATYTAANLRYIDSWPRGKQVCDDARSRRLKRWFAVDDDESGWPEGTREQLIKTLGPSGLSDAKTQDAVVRMIERLLGLSGVS
ncbi:HAD domain-containing protein [Massilia brevitalea]|uniref:HAD domain-containing protein n=1 Tax=Massilia brevitalea TaxID=442526 RepID=UPI00351D976C